MRIVSLYKTWRGEEFVLASLKSIYSQVDRIIFVHQENGWLGKTGNTVREVVKGAPDPDGKIVHVDAEGTQGQQYDAGVKWLMDNDVAYDYLQLIDTDEVWEEIMWGRVKRRLQENQESMVVQRSIACRLRDYIKSPFFRIDPPAPLRPVCFLHAAAVKLGAIGIRGASIFPKMNADDVFFHHFYSVRKDLRTVLEKHYSSCGAESEPMVDMEAWVKEVWNRLPHARNVLPLAQHCGAWQGVVVVGIADLPAAVHDNPIVQAWLKYPQTQVAPNGKGSDFDQALKRFGLPAGFGPGHPDWKMPSKRNKYAAALKVQSSAQAPAAPAAQEPAAPAPVPAIVEALRRFGLPQDFGPHHPDWKMPSKQNKYAAAMSLAGGAGRGTQNFAIFTIVSGAYQWYAPLFLDRIKKELPGATPLVYLRGPVELPEKWASLCKRDLALDDYKMDGYTTAALRFVYCPAGIDQYVLITDIDMLMRGENIIEHHRRAMIRDDLGCYDNYASAMIDGFPKLPGVHFVTREWWGKTATARATYDAALKERGSPSWDYDEKTLGRIVVESNLPYTETPRLWAHHGIHLGDFRRRLQNKGAVIPPGADDQNQIVRMLRDAEFMETVREVAPHLEKLTETIELFKKSVGI